MKLANYLDWYTEDKWTTQTAARDALGNPVSPMSEYAETFDLFSAITISVGNIELRESFIDKCKAILETDPQFRGSKLYEMCDLIDYRETKRIINLL